jgi:hypothetical protein
MKFQDERDAITDVSNNLPPDLEKLKKYFYQV